MSGIASKATSTLYEPMIEIRIRARFDPERRFVTVRRRGTLYDLGCEVVELFTVKVLAEALDRSRDTILTWERRGDLPRPLFQVERSRRFLEDGPWRTYSATQVVNANRLARLHFGDRRRIDDASMFAAFVSDLRRCWYRPALLTTPPAVTPPAVVEGRGIAAFCE